MILLALALSTQAWADRLEAASSSPEAWAARRREIREQILVAAGLWPEFERPAMKPVVFHKLERDGYSVEKVRLETWPGFHLTGNLYRPLGKTGPFPGIVSPHGHWGQGRFHDTLDGSIPGRALTLARRGFVVFSYDMVGYGDLKQLPHGLSDPAWGIGLLGLQLWNSLRAVDFLASLADVDPKRIGATGASGGGTQTFLLTAVDERIACAAPVNMVAAEFQGGCSCENAPGLRIGLNNVEIAAATAPRPLLLVACTGDWTKDSLRIEGPAAARAFKALGVPERFRLVQYHYGHNYNQESREAVYAWMARWLHDAPDATSIPEPPFKVEKREDLAVYAGDHTLPEGSVDAAGLVKVLRATIQAQLGSLRSGDAARFREVMTPALRHTLGVRPPKPAEIETLVDAREGQLRRTHYRLRGTTTPVEILASTPKGAKGRALVMAVPEDDPLAKEALQRKDLTFVVPIRAHRGEAPDGGNLDQRSAYGSCFFRSALAWEVQDLLTAVAVVRSRPDVKEVVLAGGVAALLAAPLAKPAHVVADLSGAPAALGLPGMLRIDAIRTAAALAGPAVLHGAPAALEIPGARAEVLDAAKVLEAAK